MMRRRMMKKGDQKAHPILEDNKQKRTKTSRGERRTIDHEEGAG